MATRFGGTFSPQPNPDQDGAPHPQGLPPQLRSKAERRNRFLFILPILFPLRAFGSKPEVLLLSLAACGALIAAALVTREGLRAQAAYEARRVARRPALPRKMLGSVMTGLGLALGAATWQPGLLMPALLGLAGAILHLAAFGRDPMRDKGMEGVDTFQTDRVARAIDEAEAYLGAMKDAILRTKDRGLETRVDRFATIARGLFRTIEGDPGDLTAARKYLTVYLMGARDATIKFADHFAQSRDPAVRIAYEALLGDLETNFAERSKALLANSHTDLDVEIQVLRERLKLEN
ncbi:MAG: 5-bromo-4-chloroindolyl phosphate hydrolysis family protein [Microgenomates group bacterium]